MPTNHADEPVSSTHAVEQTHDSSKQPADEAARAFILLDLAAEVELLHMQESWRKGSHTAKTLIKEPDLRIVVTVLRQGGRIEKHRAPGRLSIQTLTGRLHLQVRDQMIDLPAGRVLVLDPDTTHDVEAIDESAFLLTIAWSARTSRERE